ncbi:MAG: carboxylesterase family protein [Acidimicrobiia bacterium]|nr:carboxylesterase family protein [Acidimicrobiia bacterium]
MSAERPHDLWGQHMYKPLLRARARDVARLDRGNIEALRTSANDAEYLAEASPGPDRSRGPRRRRKGKRHRMARPRSVVCALLTITALIVASAGPAAAGSSARAAVTALIVASTGTAAAGSSARAAADGDIVRTADGAVRGTVDADHRVFQGIPFAKAPVGDLRLRAPRPPDPWDEVRDATAPGPWCAQVFTYPPGTPVQFAGDEDCLYLNIHVPRHEPGPLPVMVFVHGGGFSSGSGAGYDPRRVTGGGDVIVVTINYRLGALGFLRDASLQDPYAGNLGIADQQAALRWVRTTIAAFGGDAHNVTLWGESAGGFSVCTHLASPTAQGLFDKAIVHSAPCGNDLLTRREADERGAKAVAELGCGEAEDVAGCLRHLPVQDLAGLWSDPILAHRTVAEAPWLPVTGTLPLPSQPLEAARTGLLHDVPLVQGGTREEMRAHIAAQYDGVGEPVTAEQYPQLVSEMFGRDAEAVLAEYPHTDFATPSVALATALTDEGRMVGACSQLLYDEAASTRGPVYAYEFSEPTDQVAGDLPYGASHGADIPYLFDSYLPGPPAPPMSPERQELARELIDRWTASARSGGPAPSWDTYRHGIAMSFHTERIGPVDVGREHRCQFWYSL